MKEALIIIDVQNDYFPGGSCELYRPLEAEKKIKELIDDSRASGRKIIYIQHINPPDDYFFIEGTDGVKISDRIKPAEEDKIIIKVEPNFILRGTAYPVRPLKVCNRIVELTRNETVMQVLSFKELYGGKVCAALDRQHPRDLFDMAQFYKSHSLEEVKEGFLVLALGHNRPLHELLGPMIQEQREIFDQQFSGMSDEPFSYEEHLDTLGRLTNDVKGLFDDGDKQRLLDFVSLSGEENAWGIPHFDELPAIRWKRRNLESLRKSNLAKFTAQREALERLFEKEA